MAPAIRLVLIACCPSCAPTTLERSSSSSSFREPIRIIDASSFASSMDCCPLICALPSEITLCTTGELIVSPSYTIEILFFRFAAVASANFVVPSLVSVSSTIYCLVPVCESSVTPPSAPAISLPSRTTLPLSSWNSRDPGLPRSSRILFASVTPGISTVIRSSPS